MESVVEPKKSYRHIIYAVISLACPFIAFGLVSLYQKYAYAWFWELTTRAMPLDDSDINAGAMMGAVIVIQLIFAVGVGSLIGLAFAGMSLKRDPRFLSIGTTTLFFNLFPFFGVLWVILRGMNSGW